MIGTLVFVALALLGCKAPPDAPGELDELCGYLYEHFHDEDEEALKVGVENLDVWLQANLEETLEGYTVNNLAQETVDGLDDRDRDLTGLVGAAVGYESRHSVSGNVDALLYADYQELYEDTYDEYTRDWVTEADCFSDQTCDTVHMVNWGIANYPLSITITSESTAKMRWVDIEQEECSGLGACETVPAMVHVTWLNDPAEVSADWLTVDEQYFLQAVIPREGGSFRLMATWVIAEIGSADVPESLALSLVIENMQTQGEQIDTYIDTH